MSGVGEERWRNSRGQQPSPQAQPNQQRKPNPLRKASSISQSPAKPTGDKSEGPKGTSSGNAWSTDRGRSAGRSAVSETSTTAETFRAQDTRELLKECFNSVSSEDLKTLRYKAPGGQPANKAGGPWASKPNTMGSGKDFFLELRKQISALQHTERAGG